MNPQRKLMTSALLLVLGVGFFPMTVEGGLFTIMSIKGGSLTGSEISEAVADLNSHRIFQAVGGYQFYVVAQDASATKLASISFPGAVVESWTAEHFKDIYKKIFQKEAFDSPELKLEGLTCEEMVFPHDGMDATEYKGKHVQFLEWFNGMSQTTPVHGFRLLAQWPSRAIIIGNNADERLHGLVDTPGFINFATVKSTPCILIPNF